MIVLRRATPNDVHEVLPRLRQGDIIEAQVSTKLDPWEAIVTSAEHAVMLWAITVEDRAEALVGMGRKGDWGVPWMVSTPVIEEYPRAFAKQVSRAVSQMYDVSPALRNYAMLDNKLNIRFLSWLGFEFKGPVIKRDGCRFQLFEGRDRCALTQSET